MFLLILSCILLRVTGFSHCRTGSNIYVCGKRGVPALPVPVPTPVPAVSLVTGTRITSRYCSEVDIGSFERAGVRAIITRAIALCLVIPLMACSSPIYLTIETDTLNESAPIVAPRNKVPYWNVFERLDVLELTEYTKEDARQSSRELAIEMKENKKRSDIRNGVTLVVSQIIPGLMYLESRRGNKVV